MKKTKHMELERFWFKVDGKAKQVVASNLEVAKEMVKKWYPSAKIVEEMKVKREEE